MKKIIQNRLYDTEKARELATWENEYPRSDFHFVEETLYQKKTGEFFLYGSGNAASKYAVSVGQNCWSGGSLIIPLPYEEAKTWAEEKLSVEKYESIFGAVEEDSTKMTVTFSLRTDTVEMLKKKATETGKQLSECLDEIIQSALK